MQFYKFKVVLIFFMALGTGAFSQTDPIPRAKTNPPTTGLWLGLYTKFRLSEKLYYYAETHYRRQNSYDNRLDFAGRMSKVYNRHGLTYLANKYFEVTAGPVVVLRYTPQPGNPEYKKMVPEYRLWHQWLFIQPQMGRLKVYHQFRFEHRFKRSNAVGAEYKYTNRYRYKLYGYIPINKSYLSDGAFFLYPSAELFLQSGKSVVYNPMEDIRIYTSVGYIINKNYMVFAGHMWTLGQGSTGFDYSQSHVIRLNLYVNFDLRSPRRAIPKVHMDD